jgi:hypothetical protein
MLNGTGGRVLVGVTPEGRILVESMGRGRGAVYRLRKTNE